MEEEYESMEALNEALQRRMEEENTRSRIEFDNLSPIDMYQLLYRLFEEECSVQFTKTIEVKKLNEIPFYKLFREYLNRIYDKGELKLTARGNLPRNLCKELYGLGLIKEEYIESGIIKLNREGDSIVLQNLKVIGDLSGITKKRNNKLSLTRTGKKLFEPGQEYNLFKKVFETNAIKFNLGYHDAYNDEFQVQGVIGYTFYLLLRYGQEQREMDFYVNKNLEAFPQLLEVFREDWSTPRIQFKACYNTRIFERFLNFYGFTETEKEHVRLSIDKKIKIKVNDVFREVFKIDENKLRFRKV